MKAVFVSDRNSVSVNEVDAPQLSSDGDILVRMRACGLCGSDLEKVYGEYSMSSGRLGHEPAGVVVRAGRAVKDFSPGDRVFIHHHVACNSCHYCRHGDQTMCPSYQTSNIDPCGLAEQFLVQEWNVSRGGLIRLPDSIGFDTAALIEPLACCIRALNKCRIQSGDDIAVLGAGPAGMMHVLLAETLGARNIIVSDINEFRLKFASSCNAIALNALKDDILGKVKAATEGRGVDLCVIATGSAKAIAQAFEITRKGGKILLFGVPPKGTQLTIDASKLYSSEHTVIPSYAASEIETNEAIRLIEAGRLDVNSLITHRFDIASAAEAVTCAHQGSNAMKVIVTTEEN